MARKRSQLLSPTLLFFLLAVLVPSALSFDSDFSFYPTNAQSCLNSASASSKCSGDTAAALNKCLCNNGGGFIITAAQCLGKNDKADVGAVYNTMSSACETSNTPMSISEKDFTNAANGDVTTTTSASSTATATSTSTATKGSSTATPTETNANSGSGNGKGNSNNSAGLSKGATIGIAVGAAAVGMLAMGGLVLFLRRRQKRKSEDESSPMLAQNDYYKRNTATTFPPTEPSPDFGQFGSDAKDSWRQSLSPGYPSQGYPSPGFNKSPVGYAGPYASPPPHDDIAMHGAPGQTFEMDASNESTHLATGPVEMEAPVPAAYRPPGH